MIGERIRKIRALKGYSQDYISTRLNISQGAYSDIETDKTKPTLERIIEIANILEADLNSLISFDENQVFSNTFNQYNDSSNTYKLMSESFDRERTLYISQIELLKEEILYLRKKLDNK